MLFAFSMMISWSYYGLKAWTYLFGEGKSKEITFKVRLAKKQVIPVEVKTEPSVSITGYLARPAGEEPRAAIVFLHTCFGLSEHGEL